eukprot:m51a1_g8351 hypothetical protein (287) ;mRNA; f:48845-50492
MLSPQKCEPTAAEGEIIREWSAGRLERARDLCLGAPPRASVVASVVLRALARQRNSLFSLAEASQPTLEVLADRARSADPAAHAPLTACSSPSASERAAGKTILGLMRRLGIGERADTPGAVQMLRDAEELGSPSAAFSLGVIASRGECGGSVAASNPYEAAEHYLRAARAGHTSAMYNLGVMLRDGDGVAADRGRAMGLFQEAAVLGDPAAQCALGEMLEESGQRARAVQLYRRAAAAGDDSARMCLAGVLACGSEDIGVAQDMREAVRLWRLVTAGLQWRCQAV